MHIMQTKVGINIAYAINSALLNITDDFLTFFP